MNTVIAWLIFLLALPLAIVTLSVLIKFLLSFLPRRVVVRLRKHATDNDCDKDNNDESSSSTKVYVRKIYLKRSESDLIDRIDVLTQKAKDARSKKAHDGGTI